MSRLTIVKRGGPLVVAGVIAGLVLAAGLNWTSVSKSQTQELAGSDAEVPAELLVFDQFNRAFQTAAELARPSVVTVTSERVVRPTERRVPDSHPFREFFGEDFLDRFWNFHGGDEFRSNGLGSGVIVSEDGLVLTNNHVIDSADQIQVVLADDREYAAEVVGTDPASDLALLRIDAGDLPLIRFGRSEDLRVGEWVMAVGSPFNKNLDQTVTAGIVSAKGRQSVGIVDFEDFIQTDAAINPGNSGGALINMRGELVGINTAIATRSGGGQGVGFAIPIAMARSVMNDLLNEGRVIRGWLGVVIRTVDEDLAAGLDLETQRGVLINDLTEDGPAHQAGVERGDVVLEFNGTEVKDADHLQNLVAAVKPGGSCELEVWRDGKRRDLAVKLGERPEDPSAVFAGGSEPSASDAVAQLGLSLRELPAAEAREMDLEQGVLVHGIRRGSPAAAKNIRQGDVLLEVDRQGVSSPKDVAAALDDLEPTDPVLLLLQRGQTTFYTALKMPAETDD